MKIKYKFMLGLFLILAILGLTLNILVREVLNINMENNINNSLKDIMNNSREYVKYRLYSNSTYISEELLKQQGDYINNYISSNYKCDNQISDMQGNIIKGNISDEFKDIVLKQINEAQNEKSVLNLRYINRDLQGVVSYPAYIDGKYIGIITISKSYMDMYDFYRNSISLITFIELGVFVCIFLLAFFLTNKIIKPVINLTEAVKKVGQGDYSVPLKVNSGDEVGILSNEFINMKDKIKEQIRTIRLEKEKVEKLEEGRKRFFDNVTHELKTPLTVITGYADALRQEIVKDASFNKRANERIYYESQRLHEMVVELINVSKGDSQIEEEKSVIDMEIVLNEICEDMHIKANKYSLEILKDINKGSITGKINKIRELIINVIDNAIKYSLTEEKIYVKSFCEDNFYNIEIINKSEPISQEIFDFIFEPFIKSDNSREEESRGLGLYICSEIVKEHQGEIAIENGHEIKVKIKLPSIW